MVHLRYLRLSGHAKLPKEIPGLMFLQTLDVDDEPLTSVGSLTQLLCLRIRRLTQRVPDGIAKLTSLQELEIVYRGEEEPWMRFLKELGGLSELRVLHLGMPSLSADGRGVVMDLVESMRNLQRLEHLSLLHDGYGPVAADTGTWEAAGFHLPRCLRRLFLRWTRFSRFPSLCINPSRLPNLSYLSLHVKYIDKQDLRILGGLTDLRFLYLHAQSSAQVVCNNNPTTSDVAGDGPNLFQKLSRCNLRYSELRLVLPSNDASFLMQDVSASMLLGSEKRKNGVDVAPTLLPSVHELEFTDHVRKVKDGNDDDCGALEYFTSLQDVRMVIDCHGSLCFGGGGNGGSAAARSRRPSQLS